jgi:O-antigen/teichoic acid export membrane protein
MWPNWAEKSSELGHKIRQKEGFSLTVDMNDPEQTDKPLNPSPTHSDYVVQIARGAGIVFIGSMIGFGFRYLFHLIVARHLGVDHYGLFSLGLAVFSVVEVLAVLGMHRGMVRYVSLYNWEGDKERLKGTIRLATAASLASGVVFAVLMALMSKTLASAVFHNPDLTPVFRIFAAAVPFSALTMILVSSTQGMRIMKYKVLVKDVAETLARVVLALLLFMIGMRLIGALTAFLSSVVLGSCLGLIFFRRVFRTLLRRTEQAIYETRRFIAFCWPLFLANGFMLMEAWISVFLVGFFASSEDVGIFNAALRTSLLVQGILMSFNAIFSPYIADLHNKGDAAELKHLFQMVSKWVFSLSLPFILLIVLFPRDILNIFGDGFSPGILTLVVLGVGQLFNAVTGPLGIMIDMSGKTKISLINAVLHLTVQVLLCLILIPKHGILGAALAKAISIGLLRIIRLIQVYAIHRMLPFRIDFFKPVLAGTLSVTFLVLLKGTIDSGTVSPIPLFFYSLGFLAVYGSALWIFGFDREDKLILQKIRSKLPF